MPIHLAAEELEAILTQTDIAKTKKLRPRLEAMAAEGKAIELGHHRLEQCRVWHCAGRRANKQSGRKQLLRDCNENCQPTGRGVGN